MGGKSKGDFIRSRIDPFKKERTDQRVEGVAQLMIKLKNEIPEEIKNMKKICNVPACVNDGEIIQNFTKVLDVS